MYRLFRINPNFNEGKTHKNLLLFIDELNKVEKLLRILKN